MPELHSIQTFEQIDKSTYLDVFNKVSNVLKSIGVWNEEITTTFESFSWEENATDFMFSALMNLGYYRTAFSEFEVSPSVMVYCKGLDQSFTTYWMSFQLLIRTSDVYDNISYAYKDVFRQVEQLCKLVAQKFTQTGVYFADEAQDGSDFDGIRNNEKSKLWQFDYAILPLKLQELYGNVPITHTIKEESGAVIAWNKHIWQW